MNYQKMNSLSLRSIHLGTTYRSTKFADRSIDQIDVAKQRQSVRRKPLAIIDSDARQLHQLFDISVRYCVRYASLQGILLQVQLCVAHFVIIWLSAARFSVDEKRKYGNL